MNLKTKELSPTGAAVFVSVTIVIVVAIVLLAIAGSYALTIHEIDANNAAQAAQAAHAAAVAHALALHTAALAKATTIKAALPECKALRQLAAVGGSHGGLAGSYGVHLQAAIKAVYAHSGCAAVLRIAGK